MTELKTILVAASILFNLAVGYNYLAITVYDKGVEVGLQQAATQLNVMIEQGQLIIPTNE